jgi:aryl carrier-like protein
LAAAWRVRLRAFVRGLLRGHGARRLHVRFRRHVHVGARGPLALYFVKLYARWIPTARWLIDTLHPPEPDAAESDELPNWALAVYALIGLGPILAIIAREDTYTYAAIEFLVGWAAGHHVLEYIWMRRLHPESPRALDIIDDWLDATAAPHWPLLRRLGYAVGFAMLFAGVALYAWQAGVTRVAAAMCGPRCLATPGFEFSLVGGSAGARCWGSSGRGGGAASVTCPVRPDARRT